MSPRKIFSCNSTSSSINSFVPSGFTLDRVSFFSRSTYRGALYVRFRSLASFGNSTTVSPSGSTKIGFDKKICLNVIVTSRSSSSSISCPG